MGFFQIFISANRITFSVLERGVILLRCAEMSLKMDLSVLASGAVQTQILCARDFSAITQPNCN
jgi:hypothetical protein